MRVKGFLFEDDEGREFLVGCEQPYTHIGQKFLLRGWQRRRLVPLKCTEWELRQMVEGVLVTLHELVEMLPRFLGNREANVFVGRVHPVDSSGTV